MGAAEDASLEFRDSRGGHCSVAGQEVKTIWTRLPRDHVDKVQIQPMPLLLFLICLNQ